MSLSYPSRATNINAAVAPALTDLQANGTIQVIDLAFVRKDSSGTISIIELVDERVDHAFDRVMEPNMTCSARPT